MPENAILSPREIEIVLEWASHFGGLWHGYYNSEEINLVEKLEMCLE